MPKHKNPDKTGQDIIRVETAISPYPIHRLARKGTSSIHIERTKADGTVEQWKIFPNTSIGEPGPLAYKIDTLLINRRIDETPRPILKTIRLGTYHEICNELGISYGGKTASEIRDALRQSAFAAISARNLTYRNRDGEEVLFDADFTRYSIVYTGERLPNGKNAEAVYVILNDVYMNVLDQALTRPLDYDYLKQLPPGPQRFYEIVSYKIYAALQRGHLRAKLTYSDLCAFMPQTRHPDWNSVRSQMHAIHKLHIASGYIRKPEFKQIDSPDGTLDWAIYYVPGPKAHADFKKAKSLTAGQRPTVEEDEETLPLPVPRPSPSKRAKPPAAPPPTVSLSAEDQALVERLTNEFKLQPEKAVELIRSKPDVTRRQIKA